jgi:hypothetical protein
MKNFLKKYSHQEKFIEKVDIVAFTAFKYVVLSGIALVASYLILNVAVQLLVQLVILPRIQGLL